MTASNSHCDARYHCIQAARGWITGAAGFSIADLHLPDEAQMEWQPSMSNAFGTETDAETMLAIHELRAKVMVPIAQFYGQAVGGARAAKALRACFNIAEASFETICAQHSVEFWLPLIRKQTRIFQAPSDETCATLCLLKYGGSDGKDVIPISEAGSHVALGLVYEPQDSLAVSKLIFLASLMAAIGHAYRRVGKGSELLPSEPSPTLDHGSIDVETAMWFYDDRRPSEALLRDLGMFHNVQLKGRGIYFMGLARGGNDRQYVVPEWNASWPCLRILAPFAADTWIQILEGYREAIADLYDARLESLFHFLSGLAANIVNSAPVLEGARTGDIRLLRKGESEDEWREEVRFLLTFTDKGYFRFPLSKWLEMMAPVRSPWAQNDAESRHLTEEFFHGFSLNEKRRAEIDVSTMRPVPFCFTTPAKWVYVDVQSTEDFLAHLLQSGRDWFATQHGDRFTLAVKRFIQENRPEVEIVGWKQELAAEGKGSVEYDLLLATKSALWVVECKAFGKSPGFYRGDREAVEWRTLQLKKAFKQAQRQTAAVKQAISNGASSIPKRTRVETVVCTPSQEFIYPVDEFGFIMGNIPHNIGPEDLPKALLGIRDAIPRICTPEELLKALTLLP